MKQIILLLALFAAGFVAGRWTMPAAPPPRVEMRIDTIFYERPQPVALRQQRVAIDVPRVLFAPTPAPVVAENATAASGSEIPDNSGTPSEIPTSSADSVPMLVAVETRTYEDSLYRAQVSGPALGELGPSLDWIEVYNRTRTITRTEMKRHRFALTAGVGAAYTPQGFQPTAGVQLGVVLWGF